MTLVESKRGWLIARVLLPAILFWLSLIGGAAYLLYERSTWSEKYDRHAMEEWIKELRPFRKNA